MGQRLNRYSFSILGYSAIATVAWFRLYDRMYPVEFRTFYLAGHDLLANASPFPRVGSRAILEGHAYVYPLYAAWFSAGFALVPFHQATIAWRIMGLMAIASCGVILGGTRGLTVAGLTLLSTPIATAIQVGSVEPFLALGIAICYRLKDRPILGGLTLGLVAVVKLFLAPLLLWPLFAKRKALFATALVSSVILFYAGVGFDPGLANYLKILHRLSTLESPQGWALTRLWLALGFSLLASELLVVVTGIALILGLRAIGSTRANEKYLYSGLVLVCLVVSPITWWHYLALGIVPLLLVRPRKATVVALLLTSWIFEIPDLIRPISSLEDLAILAVVGTLWILVTNVKRSETGAAKTPISYKPIDIATLWEQPWVGVAAATTSIVGILGLWVSVLHPNVANAAATQLALGLAITFIVANATRRSQTEAGLEATK